MKYFVITHWSFLTLQCLLILQWTIYHIDFAMSSNYTMNNISYWLCNVFYLQDERHTTFDFIYFDSVWLCSVFFFLITRDLTGIWCKSKMADLNIIWKGLKLNKLLVKLEMFKITMLKAFCFDVVLFIENSWKFWKVCRFIFHPTNYNFKVFVYLLPFQTFLKFRLFLQTFSNYLKLRAGWVWLCWGTWGINK